MLIVLDKVLEHPNDIPRNVGVELKRKLDSDPGLVAQISTALMNEPERDGKREIAILRGFLKPETPPAAKSVTTGSTRPRKAKTTFQIASRVGVAKCVASGGRIELQCGIDFTRVDQARLERAVAAMIESLQEEDDLTRG